MLVCSSCLATLPLAQPSLSELRVPASLPVACGTAPPAARPGQGLGLPCLDTCRTGSGGRSQGPGQARPSNNGRSVPGSGPAPTGRPRLPAQLRPHTLPLYLPKPLCLPWEQASLPLRAGHGSRTGLDQGTGSAEFPGCAPRLGARRSPRAGTRLDASHGL